MPIIDLILKATSDDPTLPYYVTSQADGQRRLRVQAGELIAWRNNDDFPGQPIHGYGIVPLISRKYRIIRIADALVGDGDLLLGADMLTLDDEARGFLPRQKMWRIRLKDVPNNIKSKLVPRNYPDVDHVFFLNHPTIRTKLLAKYPDLATVPQNNRRSRPWDISVTRSQISPFFKQKVNEPRDVNGFPEDDLETDHEIDIGDDIY